MTAPHKPRVGLALGSGSARGWAHIGVIRALEEAGVRPELVCGTSIGALVGAAYAAGELERLESWVLGLQIKDVAGLADVSLSAGLLKGDRLMQFFRSNFADLPIEQLGVPFAAVATSLQTGAEVWLRSGSTLDAVRASIALPGIFTPVRWEGSLLVDGGLANPVPVSLARAMGADIVIAVDLNSDLLGRHLKPKPASKPHTRGKAAAPVDAMLARIQSGMLQLGLNHDTDPADTPPAMLDVLASSINIMQVLITRSRLAGEPADVLITPRLADLGLMEFHRAGIAIDAGRRAAEVALPQLQARLDGDYDN